MTAPARATPKRRRGDTRQRLLESGETPNLAKYANAGGYSPLEVCSPPQTEVSWTCIATGVDPGSHGILFGSLSG